MDKYWTWILISAALLWELVSTQCSSFEYEGHEYLFCSPYKKVSRTESATTCTSMGYYLIVLETETEFDYIRKQVNLNSCWVGAEYNAIYRDYVWEDTSTSVPAKFFSYKPTSYRPGDDCVSFEKSASLLGILSGYPELQVQECSTEKEYLCEKLSRVTTEASTTTEETTTTATTTESSSTTTTSPTPETTTESPSTTTTTTTSITTTQSSSTSSFLPATTTTTSLSSLINVSLFTPTPPTLVSVNVTSLSPVTITSTLLTSLNESLDTCSCGCPVQIPTNDTERLIFASTESEKLKKTLTVNKENLSKTIRQKTSASDARPSAQQVGYLGIIIMSVIFGSIVIMDLTYFCHKSQYQSNATEQVPEEASNKSSLNPEQSRKKKIR